MYFLLKQVIVYNNELLVMEKRAVWFQRKGSRMGSLKKMCLDFIGLTTTQCRMRSTLRCTVFQEVAVFQEVQVPISRDLNC